MREVPCFGNSCFMPDFPRHHHVHLLPVYWIEKCSPRCLLAGIAYSNWKGIIICNFQTFVPGLATCKLSKFGSGKNMINNFMDPSLFQLSLFWNSAGNECRLNLVQLTQYYIYSGLMDVFFSATA